MAEDRTVEELLTEITLLARALGRRNEHVQIETRMPPYDEMRQAVFVRLHGREEDPATKLYTLREYECGGGMTMHVALSMLLARVREEVKDKALAADNLARGFRALLETKR